MTFTNTLLVILDSKDFDVLQSVDGYVINTYTPNMLESANEFLSTNMLVNFSVENFNSTSTTYEKVQSAIMDVIDVTNDIIESERPIKTLIEKRPIKSLIESIFQW